MCQHKASPVQMLEHFLQADHLDMLLNEDPGQCVQVKLVEEASCPVSEVAMEHYRCQVNLRRLQTCIFCGVLGCDTPHLVLSSSDDEK